jgi:cob(I)alamin adenosyltransferase
MVRLTKIYTKTGDGGSTRLTGGQQVEKDDLRIEAYGTVDELNSVVGLIRTELSRSPKCPPEIETELQDWLHDLQQNLFNLGSDLSTRLDDRFEGQPVAEEKNVLELEHFIDRLNAELHALNSFVLPAGGPIVTATHLARTVCRRAERCCISLRREETIGEWVIPFLNRLSDAFFVLSRWVAKTCGEQEVLWKK